MNTEIGYNIIKNALTNPAYLQSLKTGAEETIRASGINDTIEIQEIKSILSFIVAGIERNNEINELHMKQYRANINFQIDQLKTTEETAKAFKSGLKSTIEQIESGFKKTMMMYTTAFYMGMILIICSIFFAFFKNQSLLPLIFGGLGTADIIAYFVFKPAHDLQKSRADLAQLQAAFFNWFIDAYNWNAYLGILGRRESVSHEEIQQVSDSVLNTTARTMELIEKYCGFEIKTSKETA